MTLGTVEPPKGHGSRYRVRTCRAEAGLHRSAEAHGAPQRRAVCLGGEGRAEGFTTSKRDDGLASPSSEITDHDEGGGPPRAAPCGGDQRLREAAKARNITTASDASDTEADEDAAPPGTGLKGERPPVVVGKGSKEKLLVGSGGLGSP